NRNHLNNTYFIYYFNWIIHIIKYLLKGGCIMAKKIIYFICTGNSCRSQMAEEWAKKYLSDKWKVYSAGIEAHGLNEKAIKVMEEADVDISKQTSNIVDLDILNQTDLVVTLCGDADDKCPMTPPHVQRE